MPFDDLQPVEYGWSPNFDENGETSGLAISRSRMAYLATEVLRNDYHPKWKRETQHLLRGPRGQYSFGSPMDYARIEMEDFRKLIRDWAVLMRLRHVHGVERPVTLIDPLLDKEKKEKIWMAEKNGPGWFWFPQGDYNTPFFQISENLAPSAAVRGIFTMLRAETGNAEWDLAPEDLKEELQTILNALGKTHGVYSVQMFVWLPWSMEEEQAFAKEYNDECEKYQTSQAGRKAKRLLLDNLTPTQEEDYYKKGYFFVVPDGKPMEKRNVYVIERSYPNGNILQVRRKRMRNRRTRECGEPWFPTKDFCFHTEEPHAIDDILLAQKLIIEHDEAAFIKEANITPPRGGGNVPLDWIKRSV